VPGFHHRRGAERGEPIHDGEEHRGGHAEHQCAVDGFDRAKETPLADDFKPVQAQRREIVGRAEKGVPGVGELIEIQQDHSPD